jgi:hypothetical protein
MTSTPPLERTVSHGVVQHPLPPDEGIGSTWPQLTAAGPPTDAFEEASPTGLVDAREAEKGVNVPITAARHHGSQSTLVTSNKGDMEKGLKEEDAKLVTWKEADRALYSVLPLSAHLLTPSSPPSRRQLRTLATGRTARSGFRSSSRPSCASSAASRLPSSYAIPSFPLPALY